MDVNVDLIAASKATFRDNTLALVGIAGRMKFYDGTIPATCEDPDDGTEVGNCAMSATSFAGVVGDDMVANAITPDTNTAAGTVHYFRIKGGGDIVVFQGTCGTSGEDFNFDNNIFLAGDTLTVDDFKVTIQFSTP